MTPAARNYLIVTVSYWGFTLTDGALRMLVLLYFFQLGYSPFTLAFLFLLYELAGILANLGGDPFEHVIPGREIFHISDTAEDDWAIRVTIEDA